MYFNKLLLGLGPGLRNSPEADVVKQSGLGFPKLFDEKIIRWMIYEEFSSEPDFDQQSSHGEKAAERFWVPFCRYKMEQKVCYFPK